MWARIICARKPGGSTCDGVLFSQHSIALYGSDLCPLRDIASPAASNGVPKGIRTPVTAVKGRRSFT